MPNTIAANRLLSEKIPYPLHLGITEAGTKWSGSLKSSVGLGTLLADGIGDTIRISLSTFHAEEEVKVAWEILKALQLRERGPVLIACPTCGRLQFDMDSVVAEIEQRLESYAEPIEVAVLGCAVNGIGEAIHADFGIAGAKNEGLIYAHGKPLRKVPQATLVDALFEEIDKSLDRGEVEFDENESREGAAWLAKIEAENAGELTPEKIAADGARSRRKGRVGQGLAGRGRIAHRRSPLHPRLRRNRLAGMASKGISPTREEDFPALVPERRPRGRGRRTGPRPRLDGDPALGLRDLGADAGRAGRRDQGDAAPRTPTSRSSSP